MGRLPQIVFITGATSGIGKAISKLFAQKGYDLILSGRRSGRLLSLKKKYEAKYEIKVLPLTYDIRDSAAVQAAVGGLKKRWKTIDILINNAGLAAEADPIDSADTSDWDAMIDTNVKGLLYMTRAIAPLMVKRKKGHIINIGSTAGKEVYRGGSVYCASKHAVEALTKAMRLDLYDTGLRISQISPGAVEETEFSMVRYKGDKKRANIYKDYNPLTSRDVARVVYFVTAQPPHVNIQDVALSGTQQASATLFDRSGRRYD